MLQKLRSWRWRNIVAQVGIVMVAYLGIQWWHTRDAPKDDVPAFSGVLLDGTAVNVPADIEAPTLVHFWATWCTICRLEQGSVNNVAQDHRVIAIASQSGSASQVQKVVNEREISVPVLVDESGGLASRFGVKAFPTTFVVDKNGEIRSVEVGFTTELGLRWRLWLAKL